MSPLFTMLDQGFGCSANQQDEDTQKGQVVSSHLSSTVGSLAERKGWAAKNKNSREQTRTFLVGLGFFNGELNPQPPPEGHQCCCPSELRHLSGRAAAGVKFAKPELPQSDQQLRLDKSSKPCLTIRAHRGLHLSEQPCMEWLLP